MLRDPKTFAANASVAEVREQLTNPKVQTVILADGRAFTGAVTAIPAEAEPTELARAYADPNPETLPPHASAREAFDRTAASPHRRVLVLDDDSNLLGLLCLNRSRTHLCQTPGTAEAGR